MNRKTPNRVFFGTSGFNYRDWKGRFYPQTLSQKEWLTYYSTKFSTVEINNSFYTSVKKDTYKRWYELTPEHFIFSVKGHRFITQYKKLQGVEEDVEHFLSAALILKKKLAVILWQFPASFSANQNFSRLESFLELLPLSIRHAFEFRDSSWFTEDINALLEKYNSALVIAQSGVFPANRLINKNFVYIRFHGPTSLYTSGYSIEQLKQWALKIRKYAETHDVYVYFNNDAKGHALDNVSALQSLLYTK